MNLTICSVSYDSREFLEENLLQVTRLNASQDFRWLIGENSPLQSKHRLPYNHSKFEVIEGLPVPKVEKAPGSYHHASTMNLIKDKVDTRFVLFIDPDCYILREDWIREIPDYMQSTELAIFGIPWHPRWYNKYRYFPCVHCMFVDLDKVPVKQLDFTPGYFDSDENLHSSIFVFEKAAGKKNSFRRYVLNNLLRRLKVPTIEARKEIMSSPDVGSRIEMKFRNSNTIKFEYALPVFRMDELKQTTSLKNRTIEKFLPERLCYVPKYRNYYSVKSFKDYGIFDAASLSWEEFIWEDAPFCFHLRNNTRRHSSAYLDQIKILKKCLKKGVIENRNVESN